MQALSGFEVCARLKTDPETQDIPVLFVTALTNPWDKERALAVGGGDFSGSEVLADLGEWIPDSPVIIVKAHPSSDNAVAALRLGAFDFIVKGFKNELMLQTVARAGKHRRSVVRNRVMIRQLEAKMQDLLVLVPE